MQDFVVFSAQPNIPFLCTEVTRGGLDNSWALSLEKSGSKHFEYQTSGGSSFTRTD